MLEFIREPFEDERTTKLFRFSLNATITAINVSLAYLLLELFFTGRISNIFLPIWIAFISGIIHAIAFIALLYSWILYKLNVKPLHPFSIMLALIITLAIVNNLNLIVTCITEIAACGVSASLASLKNNPVVLFALGIVGVQSIRILRSSEDDEEIIIS